MVCRLHLIFLLRQASQATFCLRVVPLYSPGGTGSIAGLSSGKKRGERVMVKGYSVLGQKEGRQGEGVDSRKCVH